MIKRYNFKYLWLWLMAGYLFFPSNIKTLEAAQLLFFFMIGMYYLPRKYYTQDSFSLIIPVLFLSLTFISLIYDLNRVIWRDLIEILKPILVLIYIFIGLHIGSVRRFNTIILPLFILSSIFGFIEILFPDLIHYFRTFYVRDDGLYIGKPINFWFTTYFAAFFYFIVGFGRVFELKNKYSHANFSLVIIAIILILFTQSRSGFLAAILLLVGWSLFCGLKNFLSVISVFVLCAMSIIVFFDFNEITKTLPYLIYGIENYILGFSSAINDVNSLSARSDQITWAFDNNELVLLGVGIGKGYNEYLESLPALYYYRFGFLGILFYFLLWFILPVCRLKDLSGVFLYTFYFIALLIISMSSVMTDQFIFIPISYLFLGSLLGFAEKI